MVEVSPSDAYLFSRDAHWRERRLIVLVGPAGHVSLVPREPVPVVGVGVMRWPWAVPAVMLGVAAAVGVQRGVNAHCSAESTSWSLCRPHSQPLADVARTATTRCAAPGGHVRPIHCMAAGRPFCSGKRKRHGMNVQVPADRQVGGGGVLA